ncbi:hypothetical protein C8R44DRAFT_852086 [Mycena epipterygia]|nr:hypothetical protein C8R44DRAFT_852086 [Mycena epipterygia]
MLTCFITMPDNQIWVAWYIITTRLFSNALFASLNSRAVLRAINDIDIELGIEGVAHSNLSHSITFRPMPLSVPTQMSKPSAV